MKNKKPIDPIYLIPKVNTLLVVLSLILLGGCIFLANIVYQHVIVNPQPTLIYRLYDNPEQNQLLVASQKEAKLNQKDLTKFVSYIVSLLDFQSQGTIRLSNYRKLLVLAEDTFKQNLETNKRDILAKQTQTKLVENQLQSVEFKRSAEHMDIVLAKITYKQVRIMLDKTSATKEEIITIALKNVNKRFYQDSDNLGGKYYGFTLVDSSFDVRAI